MMVRKRKNNTDHRPNDVDGLDYGSNLNPTQGTKQDGIPVSKIQYFMTTTNEKYLCMITEFQGHLD